MTATTRPPYAEYMQTNWYILRVHDGTRYDGDGASMLVQARLTRIGIAAHVPMTQIERRVGRGRTRQTLAVPAFPGYVFARALDAPGIDRARVKGVTGWVMAGDERVTVGGAMVAALMQQDRRTCAPAHEFTVGDTVVVTRGPMAGWEMPVVADDGEALWVEAPVMGGIRARIDPRDVEGVAGQTDTRYRAAS